MFVFLENTENKRMDPHSFSLKDPDPHSICASGSRRERFERKKILEKYLRKIFEKKQKEARKFV